MTLLRFIPLLCALCVVPCTHAQFIDEFEQPIKEDPEGQAGWAFFTGDGEATMTFRSEAGHGVMSVDATRDRRNVWWALIKRRVSDSLNVELLRRPEAELRIEARLRVSHAPRRVNLHANTPSTTDFHSHLMEFDIPDAHTWHTISMTTRDFEVGPQGIVFAQLAMMDWGTSKYRVEIDYFKVDVVNPERVGPDVGHAIPYHPPIADPAKFDIALRVSEDSIIDLVHPSTNLNNWYTQDGNARVRILSVGGSQYTILRFDFSPFAGRRIAAAGLLELTTHSVQRNDTPARDFGQVRIVEILGGDPRWQQQTVTLESLSRGDALERVFNGQMILDWPVSERQGSKTYFTISQPVLQRLLDGRTLGLVVQPLGSINAAFYASEHEAGEHAARLLFDLQESSADD